MSPSSILEQKTRTTTSTTCVGGGGHRLKFVPFSSSVELPFWVHYNRLKLETIQLSEAPLELVASYGCSDNSNNSYSSNTQPRLECHEHSLPVTAGTTKTATAAVANERCQSRGVLLGYNTVEGFQTVDKNDLLRRKFLDSFWNKVHDDAVVLSSLNMFVLITYCDLKHHKVVYWFGFPSILAPISTTTEHEEPQLFTQVYSPALALDLAHSFHAFRLQQQQEQQQQQTSGTGLTPYFVWMPQTQTCIPLSRTVVQELNSNNNQQQQLVYCFLDPSTTPHPGWPLRNLIAYLSFHLNLGGHTVRILSYRPGRLRRLTTTTTTTTIDTMELDEAHNVSYIYDIRVPTKQDFGWSESTGLSKLQVAGWEFNARGKPGPRQVDLRPLLDAHHLAVQAADLNLKLMKWRMIPDLKIDLLRETKILIVGAGTLGCNVARTCLGWGFRSFTFVDSGTVQYSNPVRQPLFTLADCTAGPQQTGLPKAVAAAQALTFIAPDVQAHGIVLNIPMPGHAESREAIHQSVETLQQLIQETDVIFLLTDTRESRWLPTVMAAAAISPKILINAALGLDSWLVMRHGHSHDLATTTSTHQHQRLGCYFCNDVVAPENSQKNRTLDQQCTVTRPGLAPIASSMAVELLVALLHHPQGAAAPAPPRSTPNQTNHHFSPVLSSSSSSSSPLGLLPHQIRGSLVTYTLMTPSVPAFGHCTACASSIVQAYRGNAMELVYQACACPTATYLEELAGLDEFRQQADTAMLDDDGVWEEDDIDIEDNDDTTTTTNDQKT